MVLFLFSSVIKKAVIILYRINISVFQSKFLLHLYRTLKKSLLRFSAQYLLRHIKWLRLKRLRGNLFGEIARVQQHFPFLSESL